MKRLSDVEKLREAKSEAGGARHRPGARDMEKAQEGQMKVVEGRGDTMLPYEREV